MILAIAGYSLGEARSLAEILALFKRYEARWIELWPFNLEGGDRSLPGWEHRYEGRDVSRAEELLNTYGVGAACVTTAGAFSKELVADPQDYLSTLKGAIDVADALCCKLVNCYCYYFALGREAPIKPFVHVMRPAADYAAEKGITLVLENEAHDATSTVDGMLKILEAVDSPALKTTYDATNYYQASEEGFPDAYNRLKEHIAYVHVKGGCIYNPSIHTEACRGGSMTGRSGDEDVYIYYPPLPEGAVNMERLLSRLREESYKGFCTIEPHVPPALVENYYDIEIPYLRQRGVH